MFYRDPYQQFTDKINVRFQTLLLWIAVLGFSLNTAYSENNKPISKGEAQTRSIVDREGASSNHPSVSESELACISEQNLSISETGVSEITPGMMLSGNFGDPSDYIVEIIDPPIYTNIVTCDMVGETLSVRVKEIATPSNSCWGYVTIEDKLPPAVPCNTITVPCNTDLYAANTDLYLPGVWDNCTDEDELDIWFSQTIHDLYCDPNFVGYINRTWHISDEYGNETVCNQRINFGRLSLPLVDFPDDITMDCANPNTDTAYTGQPTVNGEPISNFCELVITYTDQVTPLCGNTYSLSRNWSIVDWCTGNSITDVQLITITDDIAPVINCPSNTTINAGNGDCTATYFVPSIPAHDNCTESDDLDYQVEVDGYDADAQMPVVLDLGVHVVDVTVTDDCGNSSTCSYTVTVQDLLPPILDCHDITVEIDDMGDDLIFYANQLIGNIIVDNCGTDELLIKRIQSHCNNPSDLYFGSSVKLCCDDVGDPVESRVKVIDNEGNSSVCDLNIVVLDNTPPEIECPDDITLPCGSDVSDLSEFGSPDITDNCGYSVNESVDDNVNDCGEGTIIRTFTVTDDFGNSDSCSQLIELINDNPFDEGDITWPDDVTISECSPDTDPSNTGAPQVDAGDCTQIGISYSDDPGPGGEPCLEITRLWSVTDTCTAQTLQYSQEILILNNAGPDLTVPSDISTTNDPGLCGAVIDLGTATTTDCNTAVVITNDYNDQGANILDTFPVGSTEVVFTAVDACGNSSTGTVTVDISDTEIPFIDCPDNISVSNDSGACSAFVSIPLPDASDNCGVDSIDNDQTPSDSASGVYPVGVTEVIYTVYDAAGNSASCDLTVTVIDDEEPQISCPANITVGTDSAQCNADVSIPLPTYSDNCAIDTVYNDYTLNEDASGTYALGTTTVEYTVLDETGNSTTCTFTVTVVDDEDPTIECPQNVTVSASPDSCSAFVDIPVPDLGDNCQTDTVYNDYTDGIDASGIYFVGTTTVIYTVIDASGNSESCSFTVTVTDDQDPQISCPADITVGTGPDSCSAFVSIDLPLVSDNCGVDSTSNDYTGSMDASGVYPEGTTTVVFTVTDVHGNSTTCSFTVTVIDEENPTISCPQNITVSSDSTECSAFVDIPLPVSGDNCGVDSVTNDFTGGDDASGTYPVGTTTVSYTVFDLSGNSTTCSFTVTVEDDISPSITCPGDITMSSDSASCSAVVTIPLPDVSDNCAVDSLYNDYNGSEDATDTFPVGTTQVTYTVIDSFGNSTTCSFTVTVEDDISPSITCPGDITMSSDSASCSAVVTIPLPDVSDNCGVDSLYNDYNGSEDATDTFPVGTTQVIYTVMDSFGNSTTCSFTVTVEDDIPPSITCPGDITMASDSATCSVFVQIPLPDTSENCGVDSLYNDYNGTQDASDVYDVGTTVVTYTIIDLSGNSATCQFTVTVTDQEAPFINCPSDTTVQVNTDSCYADIDIPLPSVGDACGIDTFYNDYTGDEDASGVYPLGMTTVTYTVIDSAGNSVSCSFTVNVEDDQAPIITCPDPITVNTDPDSCNAFVSIPSPAVSDECTITSVVNDFNQSEDASDIYPIGTTTVIYTATDSSGNTATCQFTVTVEDNAPPVFINCPPDITIACDSNYNSLNEFGMAEATDNCDVTVTQDSLFDLDQCGMGTITRTWIASDPSGNEDTCVQAITVNGGAGYIDSTDIIWPEDTLIVFTCEGNTPDSLNSFPFVDPEAGNCNNVSYTYSDSSVMSDLGCAALLREFTVVDSCQINDTSDQGIWVYEQLVVINDTVPPTLTVEDSVIVELPPGECDSAFVNVSATAFDDCTDVTITNNSAYADEGGADASGMYPMCDPVPVVFTAEDSCGNSTTDTTMVHVRDTVAPIIMCDKVEFEYNDELEAIAVADSFVISAMDNCTDSADLHYSFSLDPADSLLIFTCDIDSNEVPVTVYAIDECGNFDSCSTTVGLTDPNNFCPPDTGNLVIGHIQSMGGDPMSEVEVYVSSENGNSMSVSDSEGVFRVDGIPDGSTVSLEPFYNRDPLNGVSTYDVVLITKHILGLQAFNSPDKLIAADVNKSGGISAADLVEIRKLILGLIDEFDNNTSWRFVDAEASMEDPLGDVAGYIEIQNIQDDITDLLFHAIKIGDVNYSAELSDGTDTEERVKPLRGGVEIERTSGSTYSMRFKAPEDMLMDGMQGSFPYEGEEIRSVKWSRNDGAGLSWNSNQFNITEQSVRFSWNQNPPVPVEKGDVLFALEVEAESEQDIKNAIRWEDEFVPGEVYGLSGGSRTLGWKWDERANQSQFVLYQNVPNPFEDKTVIPFYLPADETVRLRVFSVSGQLLYEGKRLFDAGHAKWMIQTGALNSTGIMYYEIQTSRHKAVKKMVKVRK